MSATAYKRLFLPRYIVMPLLLGVGCIWGIASPTISQAQALYSLEGEWVEGGLLFGQAAPGASVQFKGEPVMVSSDGAFVLGLHRNEEEPVTLSITNADGQSETKTHSVVQREYRLQEITGIKRQIMEPSKEDQDRIWGEIQMTRKARGKRLTRKDFLSDFKWPLTGPVTGVYGSQRSYNGVAGTPHYGLDIAAPTGTPVLAPAPGIVTLVHENMFYSGGTLIVDHGHALSSTFIHLSKVLVNVGDEIATGDPIAEVGATGRVTGPHLDWRMNWKSARIDPQRLIPTKQPVPTQSTGAP